MKITVTLYCRHEDGFFNHESFDGTRGVFTYPGGVVLDGKQVVRRDRRALRNREPGHSWLNGKGDAFTGYTIRAET